MSLIVVVNPVCGDSAAQPFVDEHVLPLLEKHGKSVNKFALTNHAGHAGELVIEFLESVEGPVTILLASGDGTLHEVVNTLSTVELKGTRAQAAPSKISLVLVPCGTANALYSSFFHPSDPEPDPIAYKLKSVQSYIAGHPTKPLTVAFSTLSTAPSTARTQSTIAVSAVVTSTALHASILHDSEALRASIPGLERFKLAAQQNITRWYHSDVKLLPAPAAGVVEVFDPTERRFVAHEDSHIRDPIVDLDGPFAYFLSTVNVDRLEPAFQITPLHSSIPPSLGTMEVVVVRPLRDPATRMDSEECRAAFAEKLIAVLGGAYQQGSHVNMRYSSDGKIILEGTGRTVVEYFRCGGWEWVPHDDDRAHLVCADGDIITIQQGGKALCTAATPVDDNAGFGVYV